MVEKDFVSLSLGLDLNYIKHYSYGKGIFAAIIFAYLIVSGISMEDLMVSPARNN